MEEEVYTGEFHEALRVAVAVLVRFDNAVIEASRWAREWVGKNATAILNMYGHDPKVFFHTAVGLDGGTDLASTLDDDPEDATEIHYAIAEINEHTRRGYIPIYARITWDVPDPTRFSGVRSKHQKVLDMEVPIDVLLNRGLFESHLWCHVREKAGVGDD
jgi:hypothetical protein